VSVAEVQKTFMDIGGVRCGECCAHEESQGVPPVHGTGTGKDVLTGDLEP